MKNWIHTALYGFPVGYDHPATIGPETIANLRKYKVRLLTTVRLVHLAKMSANTITDWTGWGGQDDYGPSLGE